MFPRALVPQDVLATFPPRFRDIPCKVTFAECLKQRETALESAPCQPLLFDLAFPCIEHRPWDGLTPPAPCGLAAMDLLSGLPTSKRFSRRSKKVGDPMSFVDCRCRAPKAKADRPLLLWPERWVLAPA